MSFMKAVYCSSRVRPRQRSADYARSAARIRSEERAERAHHHASLAADALADVDDAALLFGLIARVGQKQTLAAGDSRLEDQRAAIFVGVDRIDLLVERLLVRIRAINEQRHAVRVAQAFTAVGIVSRGIRRRTLASARDLWRSACFNASQIRLNAVSQVTAEHLFVWQQ